MADLQCEFSELLELLEKVQNSCEKKRKEVELSCQDYREILSPWPHEAKTTEHGEKREQDGEVPKGEGATGDIPEREIQELKLLDNVLAKAEKVRKRHEREVRETDCQDEGIINGTLAETSNQKYDEENCKVKDERQRPESGIRVSHAQVDTDCMSRGQKSRIKGNEQVASISKTKLNKLIYTSTSAKTPSVSVKLPPKSSRPPASGVKKTYKLQAPFKTEPERRKVSSRTQRQTSRPVSASTRTSQVSQTSSLSTRPKVTSASRKVQESKKRTVAQSSSQQKNNVASSSVSKYSASTSDHLERESERNPTNQQSDDIAKWLEGVKLSGIGEGDQVTASEHKEEQEIEKKRFLLKEDASELVIPGKWKKLCAQNLKFRQKVREMQLKQDQSTHKQHFVDRLERVFSNNEECSDVEIPYKLMDIQRKKGRLLEMVQEADIQSLSQDSSWQDICHAKVLLEFVNSQLRELISDVSQIKESENAVRNSKLVQLTAVASEEMSDTASSTAHMWLPEELVHRKCLEMSHSPEVMVYNDLKDLQRIITLQHEAQILQLHIHIQKLVGDRILPLLQDMDRKNPQFLSLYRTVYSILTTGGERFPTLVRDV
uniref:Uncharacterized protein n=1 Tax=Branchiostoma floridae TaxID=7739 RepID=C3XWK6_BRAFL|eukprot:XP_002611730.1 hypothetical protein BRAFLDRAFT_128731 [Branchiostoma floridae]